MARRGAFEVTVVGGGGRPLNTAAGTLGQKSSWRSEQQAATAPVSKTSMYIYCRYNTAQCRHLLASLPAGPRVAQNSVSAASFKAGPSARSNCWRAGWLPAGDGLALTAGAALGRLSG